MLMNGAIVVVALSIFMSFFFVHGWRFRTRTLNFIDVSGSMEGQGLTCRGIMSLRRVHCRA